MLLLLLPLLGQTGHDERRQSGQRHRGRRRRHRAAAVAQLALADALEVLPLGADAAELAVGVAVLQTVADDLCIEHQGKKTFTIYTSSIFM